MQKYLNKVSGPLLDRIDLHVEVTPVAFNELSNQHNGEASATIRERVISARDIQAERYKDHPGIYANAQMSSKLLREICVIGTVGENLLKKAMEKLNLSARAYDRILKVSRTIADLSASEDIKPEHLADAIHFEAQGGLFTVANWLDSKPIWMERSWSYVETGHIANYVNVPSRIANAGFTGTIYVSSTETYTVGISRTFTY